MESSLPGNYVIAMILKSVHVTLYYVCYNAIIIKFVPLVCLHMYSETFYMRSHVPETLCMISHVPETYCMRSYVLIS